MGKPGDVLAAEHHKKHRASPPLLNGRVGGGVDYAVRARCGALGPGKNTREAVVFFFSAPRLLLLRGAYTPPKGGGHC